MINDKDKKYVRLTYVFFSLRFPEKKIDFEMKCGYFWEWVARFRSGNVRGYADGLSLECLDTMHIEGYI